MTNKTSNSSNSLPSPETGATCGELAEPTDSPWRPSWWRWLISALSGIVEIEKQAALDEQRHAQKMSELRTKNKRLAELQSKLNEILHS
jgi:hypothetical protein